MQKLTGYRTYISGALLFVVGGLLYTGLIDAKTAQVLSTVLGSLGLVSLRAALNK